MRDASGFPQFIFRIARARRRKKKKGGGGHSFCCAVWKPELALITAEIWAAAPVSGTLCLYNVREINEKWERLLWWRPGKASVVVSEQRLIAIIPRRTTMCDHPVMPSQVGALSSTLELPRRCAIVPAV